MDEQEWKLNLDEVNFVETFLAEQMTKEIELKSFVPTSVKPRCFLTFVYDNNDINPESLYGRTMHVTNGIIVQRVDPRLIKEPEPDSNPKEDFPGNVLSKPSRVHLLNTEHGKDQMTYQETFKD